MDWHQLDELSRERPELWAKCYPKIYKTVDGGEYYSPKIVSYFLLIAALKAEQSEVQMYKNFGETVEMVWASRLAGYGVPIFWLSREITEALTLTTLPGFLDFRTMKLPFEAAVFMLPKNTLSHQADSDVVFVSYARAAEREEIPSINSAVADSISGRGDFTAFAGMIDGRLLNYSHPWEHPIDIAELEDVLQNPPNSSLATGFLKSSFEDAIITSYDKHFLARVSHLVFNTLQLMLSKPDLVSMGSLDKEVHDKRKSVKSFWFPNTIGKDYRLRRNSRPVGGTHASPRGHWVRGFWRDQACGPNHSEHREIWIEPFWRGGE